MWQNWPMSREPAPADAVIASVRQWIAEARSVVALTGAGIATDSGIPDFHGHTREVVCLECGERAAMERALTRVRAGEDDPPCRSCGGILKAATISFGQALVADDLMRAQTAARHCDLMLAVGSTLSVFPIAGVVPVAKEAGARVVIVNAEPTAMDHVADAVLRGRVGTIVPAVG